MTKQFTIRRAGSFAEAEDQDLAQYAAMSPTERLDLLQFLREQEPFSSGARDAARAGLRRVARVLKYP